MPRHLTLRRVLVAVFATSAFEAVPAPLPARAAAGDATLEAETMVLPSGAGATYGDAGASGGRALLIWSNGTASGVTTTPRTKAISVRARGELCFGAPRMEVRVGGILVLSAQVSSTTWTQYTAPVSLPAGTHSVSVSYKNDYVANGCDRNLRLDRISAVADTTTTTSTTASPTTTTTTTTKPSVSAPTALSGSALYVDPYSNAAREAAALRSSNPARAALFDKIAGQPQADWVGDWIPTSDLAARVGARINTITAAGAVPVLATYAIPLRDCGSYSAGGIGTPEGYQAWVRELARGIGGLRTAVVLEPDALAQLPCLTADKQQTRLALLAGAVDTLTASGAIVYLDAGNSAWVPAETMVSRLQAAGVTKARGFSLNVSNFRRTADEVAYGRTLSDRLGGKGFVIDTSRNGLGPYDGSENWCNPPGRALGERPTTATAVTGLDALLWVKRPGESDGTCRGGPSAGTWWPDYAAGLAERSLW